jgi:NAD(P)-dependent dehydrogenase (short-subunit alcohol dehydrogenase family)
MGKLEGKVAVITGGSSGMALASAKRFVEEGAYVFITGRRQEALDEAVRLIGRHVTGVRGDAANLDDLDRLFDTDSDTDFGLAPNIRDRTSSSMPSHAGRSRRSIWHAACADRLEG